MDELLAAARPRAEGPAGILVLPPEHHVLLLAVHSWAHEPLRRLRDIVDIALVGAAADRHETERLARRWGIERLWVTTRAVVESVQWPGARPHASAAMGAQPADRTRADRVGEPPRAPDERLLGAASP